MYKQQVSFQNRIFSDVIALVHTFVQAQILLTDIYCTLTAIKKLIKLHHDITHH